ncbi:MAG: hypothetical protein RL071_2530 [Pseudomonadota bacterium]
MRPHWLVLALSPLVLAGCFPALDYKGGAVDTGAVSGDGLDGLDGAADGDGDGADDGDDQGDGAADGGDGSADCLFYADADLDGFGAGEATEAPCDAPPTGLVSNADDCDDARAESYPGAGERCDALDNDCDGVVDNDIIDVWYTDLDGDRYGDPAARQDTCLPTGPVAEDGTDCDDATAAVNPGAPEVCDGIDNDCDALPDDLDDSLDLSTAPEWWEDVDADGYGTPVGRIVEACVQPEGFADNATDCDDRDAAVHPDAGEDCAAGDRDCDGLEGEADPDLDAATLGTYFLDGDADGFGGGVTTLACGVGPGVSDNEADCNDGDRAISPLAAEVCDELDNDCDGLVDDDDDSVDLSTGAPYYTDADADSYGSAEAGAACAAPAGAAAVPGDCDDGDAATNPGAAEVCGGGDEDCDGLADDGDPSLDLSSAASFWSDRDGDSYGDPAAALLACLAPTGAVANDDDCDDARAAINPGATEVCNSQDDDCDALIDDADTSVDRTTGSVWYTDADRDSFGGASSTRACSAPAGTVATTGDCDDSLASVNPTAREVCNGRDDDCDSLLDASDPSVDLTSLATYYRDADGDGYGTTSPTTAACSVPTGYSAVSTDCDDSRVGVNPAATEVCNAADDDCDALIDDSDPSLDRSTTSVFFADADSDGLGDPAGATASACAAPAGFADNDLDCDDSGFSDLDTDELQDCDDEDDDGDGLRDVWDAAARDPLIARGPTAGLGLDGAASITSSGTITVTRTRLAADAAAGATSLQLSSAAGLLVGDELLVFNQQGSGAGTRQFVFVAGISGAVVTIEPPLSASFRAADMVLVQLVPHYTALTISGAQTVPAFGSTPGGVYVARATGNIVVSGSLTANGAGFRGGAGVTSNSNNPFLGEGHTGAGARAAFSSVLPLPANGSGGGAAPAFEDTAVGGGGGGHGAAGSDGVSFATGTVSIVSGGTSVGSAALGTWFLGGGGGGGQPDDDDDGDPSNNVTGNGGNGGGLIALYSGGTLTVSGTLGARGSAGGNASWSGWTPIAWWRTGELGGGGGGAGGQVLLVAPTVTVSAGAVTATGGAGGTGLSDTVSFPYTVSSGGAGATGRVRVESTAAFSGSTSPAAATGAFVP